MAEAFTGFPPGASAFLAGLAADNTKAYFDGNRGAYASDVAAPLRALVIAVGQRLRNEADRDLCFDPTVGKSLFRISRDTRFSADKTPAAAPCATCSAGSPSTVPGCRPAAARASSMTANPRLY